MGKESRNAVLQVSRSEPGKIQRVGWTILVLSPLLSAPSARAQYYQALPDGSLIGPGGYQQAMPDGSFIGPGGYKQRLPDGSYIGPGGYQQSLPDGSLVGPEGRYCQRLADGSLICSR
jgi:hypothetical protein